jgi:gliding motility-associated-like protein
LFSLLLIYRAESSGQTKLIHYWDMNNTLPAGGAGGLSVSPLAAEYSTLGHAYIVYNNTVTTAASCGCPVRDSLVDNGAGGSTLNEWHVLGNDTGGTSGGNLYIRTRNPTNNMKFLWYMPTTGYQNILLTYASELSSAGKPVQNYSYSLDSGLTFITTGLSILTYTAGISWGVQSINLSSIAGITNNPKFVFCISYSGAAAQATSGNDRYDNISLRGDSICPSYTLQPINQTVCQGSSTSFFTHVIGGINNTYHWQVNTGSGFTNISNGGVYSGSTSDSLVLTGIASGMNNYQYQCIVSSGSCGNITTNNVELLVNPSPTVTINTATICAGNSTTLTANGATTYTWSPATGLSGTSGASVTANPTSTTVYTINGANSFSCVNTTTTNVTVNPIPTIGISGPSAMCVGQSATLTASGAINYTWTAGPNTSTYVVSPASNSAYEVTGVDANNCSNTSLLFFIIVKSLPTISTNTATICYGNNTLLGASGANTYTWSPASSLNTSIGTSVTANPTITTTYTIAGTASDGCINTNTTTVIVNPLPTITANTATICAGNTATLTANGATTYTWNTGATNTSIINSPTLTTNYTVTGTDGNNCINTATTIISVNPLPTITVNSPTICAGATTTLTASGANTYTWNTSATTVSISPSPTVTTNYTVTATDGNNCMNSGTSTITVNTLPIITINSPTICVGATTTLTASGANTYTWNTSATTVFIVPSPTVTTNYTVTGTDGNNCINSGESTITVNPLPTIIVNTATICAGETATLTPSGANTYTWNTSATTSSIEPSPAVTTNYTVTGTDGNNCVNSSTSTVTVNPLPVITVNTATICAGAITTLTASGSSTTYTWNTSATTVSISPSPTVTTNYTVSGTDANNCTNSNTTTITVNPLPAISINSPTICAGTTTTLTASGANTYTWNTGALVSSITSSPTITTSYTVSGTDGNNCTNSDTTTITVSTLPTITINSPTICIGATTTLTANGANTYTWNPTTGLSGSTGTSVSANPTVTTTYSITGSNGCINSTTATVTVNSLPTITINTTTVCAGSIATLTASGAITYTWNTGSVGAIINPTPTVTTNYTVSGTDGNNCINSGVTSVAVNSLPTITVNTVTVCAGNIATLTASGANTYTWNTGVTGITISPSPTVTTNYTVVGTDGNNCTNIGTSTVTVNPLPTISANTAIICAGNTATLTANGANTYTWNTGTTGASITPSPTITTNYTVSGTDANNCTGIGTSTVTVNTLPIITIVNIPVTAICAGNTTTLTASGANTYVWNTGMAGAVISPSPTVTTNYTVSGTDANNCTNTGVATIFINPLPTIIVNAPPVCIGNTATLTALGANTYTWNTGATASTITLTPTTNTTYTVSGTDGNNCVNTTTQTVVVNSLPTITINGASSVCIGQSTILTASGGISYVWTGGVNTSTNTVSPTTNSTYTVTGTDANSCVNTATTNLSVNATPTLSITGAAIVCGGQPIMLTASGANTYTWTGGVNTATNTISPTTNTTYTVTGTNANNCSGSAVQTVTVNALPTVQINGGTALLNITSGSPVTIDASGAATYQWISSGISCTTCASITESPSANIEYCVIGTAANTCTNTACINVVVAELCGTVFIPDAFSPNGDGQDEVFLVYGNCITSLSMQIFDRWGNKVFETTSQASGWDGSYNGSMMNTGTYIYQASYTLNTGETDKVKGNLILMR